SEVLTQIHYRIDSRTGLPLRTKKEARDYRDYVIAQLQDPDNLEKQESAVTFQKVWDEYIAGAGKGGQAPSTVTKHSSVWENHIKEAFGTKYISGKRAVTTTEINEYLAEKYYNTDLSYGYVEGFLKVFYLLYGEAYRRNYINLETITKYTKERNIRIQMPKKTQVDEEADSTIQVYSRSDVLKMYEVFESTDLELPFMLGIFCGLRESEIFGLMWDDWDYEKNTLTINKQLVYVAGAWSLTRVKTLASSRTIDVPDTVSKLLSERRLALAKAKGTPAYRSRANEIVMDLRDKQPVEIIGGDFINRKLYDGNDGKLLTTNSFKYYSRKIKADLKIDFKTHGLRKTHLTNLASSGFPLKSLMARAGHKKLETSLKYYITEDETSREQALRIINSLNFNDYYIDVDVDLGFKKTMRMWLSDLGEEAFSKLEQSEGKKRQKGNKNIDK
ncbi:site-specific integrase, partial [Enterococcus asini]